MILRRHGILAVLISVSLVSFARSAPTFNYPDQMGTTVMFTGISEDTRGEPNPLFGAPSVLGDQLDFDPTNFFAKVNFGSGPDRNAADGQLNFTIMSKQNSTPISDVFINEAGDYTLSAGILGTGIAFASVAATVRYEITHVDGNPLPGAVQGTTNLVFTPFGTAPPPLVSGEYITPGDAGAAVPWTGALHLDIDAILAAANVSGSATKIKFAIDNVLQADAANGGRAFIAKKDFDGLTITVPEPATAGAAMFLAVATLLAGRRRLA